MLSMMQLLQGQGQGQGEEQKPRNTRICNHWQSGKCNYGAACQFSHEGPGGVSDRGVYPGVAAKVADAANQAAVPPAMSQANSALASLGIDFNSLLQASGVSTMQVPEILQAAAQQMAAQRAQMGGATTEEQQLLAELSAGVTSPQASVAMKPTRPCQHWEQFKCNYGDSCKFSHDGPGGPSPRGLYPGLIHAQRSQGSFEGGVQVDRSSRPPCSHWAMHKCNYGANCKFSHDGPGGPAGSSPGGDSMFQGLLGESHQDGGWDQHGQWHEASGDDLSAAQGIILNPHMQQVLGIYQGTDPRQAALVAAAGGGEAAGGAASQETFDKDWGAGSGYNGYEGYGAAAEGELGGSPRWSPY